MRIVILTLGTRGDVQPYIALGIGLQQAGHSVTLATSVDFEAMVKQHGLSFGAFQMSIRQLVEDPDGRAAFTSKRAAIRMARKVGPMMPRLLDDAWCAARNAQAILFHPKVLNGLDIAEKLKIPGMVAFYLPALSPTRAFPAPFLPGPASWGRFLNRASHWLFLRLLTAPYRRVVNRWRQEALGLEPRPFLGEAQQRYGRSVVKLYGYSRHVVPMPQDWDSSAHVTGQWFLHQDSDPELSPEVDHFLGSGPPPVLVGFGSIVGQDPAVTSGLVEKALIMSGQRGLLVGGWGGLCGGRDTERIRFVERVSYSRILPRTAAVVHHGGAGSTGEGLRAGRPTIVCPFFGDQPFWGRRVHALGVGPRPIPQKQLSAEALAEAIRTAVSDPEIRQRALALGKKIQTEDGVGRAVEVVERELAG